MVTRLDDYNDRARRPRILIGNIDNITFVPLQTAPPLPNTIEIKCHNGEK
jgi:hypothetical protein